MWLKRDSLQDIREDGRPAGRECSLCAHSGGGGQGMLPELSEVGWNGSRGWEVQGPPFPWGCLDFSPSVNLFPLKGQQPLLITKTATGRL